MNYVSLVYSTSINANYSFQVNGVQEAYINSTGLNVNDDITCYSCNTNTATVTSFLYVSNGIGIGITTSLFPLHQSSYQTYKYLNYNGIGGPGGYTNNYSIYCSYAVCASEFNAVSDGMN